ncbi:DNA-binding MarR family transcriptional regulator [Virgibacillus halotolerans]|uniref:MarR family winged helix-turn-helix transcriptional regulator n=1 Tax=Virgibacillus halotolerans TaxID=1071053 RepID=UPI00195FC77C|nr:MarR family transcriptional regulator [Virgibacillus halotolerans]MBM7598857.1 DNA-binding MarR family transcriptional regulator [Virgibacillus halotolerans]
MEEHDFLSLEDIFRKIMKKMPGEWKKQSKMGYSRSEVLLLYILKKRGQQRSSELASQLSVTTGGLTGITDKMVEGGYIERSRDNKDRRVVYLTITEKGSGVLVKLYARRKTFIKNLFNGVSKEEIDQFRNTAEKILANFDDEVDKTNETACGDNRN